MGFGSYGGRGGGEKGCDFGYILRMELIGLIKILDVGCERKRRVLSFFELGMSGEE